MVTNQIETAMGVFADGAEKFTKDPKNRRYFLTPQLSCQSEVEITWPVGNLFYK